MSPESLRRRMTHGNIYPAERVDVALGNYFRLGNLTAPRELALLWVADQVDDGMQDYRERHGIAEPWETKERVVVAVTGSPSGEQVIRPDMATALVGFATAENASQLLLGSTDRSRWEELSRGSIINQVIRGAGDIDVHVISARPRIEEPESEGGRRLPRLPRRNRLVALSRRRVVSGWILAVIGMPALVLALTPARHALGPTGALPELLLGVVVVAAAGGVLPGLFAAVAGFGFADWFLIPLVHSLPRAGRGPGLRRGHGRRDHPGGHPRRRSDRDRQHRRGAGRERRAVTDRILVVDDERQIGRTLELNLAARGYAVDLAHSGELALELARRRHPDLIVLDLGLPGIDGIDVVKALRAWTPVPIVVLSARDGEAAKVSALDAGADDFVVDLMAKRITGPGRGGGERVEIRLTPTQWELVELLVRNRGRLVTQRQLLQAVWGPGYGEETHYLRVFMAQIRRKLEPDPSHPRYFITEAGIGHRFEG